MARLGAFSVENAKDIWGIDTTTRQGAEQAIMRGLGALNAGLVAAELRSLKMTNEQLGREWYVPSFTPIHIEPDGPETPVLAGGSEEDPGLPDLGD
jgi:hypothetical protein